MCCYCIKRIPPPDKYTSSRSASAPVLRRPVPSPLTSHSICIRAATTAGAEGLPVQLIKVLGRWKPFMHTRHKSGHLETIYLAYITYTSWTVLYSSYMYFCEFFIVITILLLFGFASSLPSSPKRARQDDSENLGISNFFICQPKSVHQALKTAIFLFFYMFIQTKTQILSPFSSSNQGIYTFKSLNSKFSSGALLCLLLFRFVQRMLNNPTLSVDQQSEMVHDFYGVSTIK